MSVYWIGRAKVRDPEGMRRYGQLVARASTLVPQEVLVRGGDSHRLEGSSLLDRQVIIRFQSMEDALRYYHSPLYQEAALIRQAACESCELVLVQGLDIARP